MKAVQESREAREKSHEKEPGEYKEIKDAKETKERDMKLQWSLLDTGRPAIRSCVSPQVFYGGRRRTRRVLGLKPSEQRSQPVSLIRRWRKNRTPWLKQNKHSQASLILTSRKRLIKA